MATERICEHCGTPYVAHDGYCKNCWKALPREPVEPGVAIGSYEKSAWEAFIGKNADRYTAIYQKNEGKPFFLHTNFAALFFGSVWMFYRKMYKFALIWAAITFAFSLLCGTVYMVSLQDELQASQEAVRLYDAYTRDPEAYPDVDPKALREVIHTAEEAFWKVSLYTSIPPVILQILFSFMADWLYRCHIERQLKEPHPNGGTSLAAFFLSWYGIGFASNLLSIPTTYGFYLLRDWLLK